MTDLWSLAIKAAPGFPSRSTDAVPRGGSLEPSVNAKAVATAAKVPSSCGTENDQRGLPVFEEKSRTNSAPLSTLNSSTIAGFNEAIAASKPFPRVPLPFVARFQFASAVAGFGAVGGWNKSKIAIACV